MKVSSHMKKFGLPLGLGALTLVCLSGCATPHHAYLVPAPSANLTNGGQGATASDDGVTITVIPGAWNGRPHDLYRLVTPLRARIENHGNNPMRLAYNDFQLQGPRGRMFAALPPTEITATRYGDNIQGSEGEDSEGSSSPQVVDVAWRSQDADHHDHDGDHDFHHRGHGHTRIIISPGFGWGGFYYAPYWGYGYAGIGAWPGWWGPDMGYYSAYYPYMTALHLPTRSMLRKGLPEGVIAPGGYVDGFLYFSKVNPNLPSAEFIARLQDAKTGKQFGTVEIPFQVDKEPGY